MPPSGLSLDSRPEQVASDEQMKNSIDEHTTATGRIAEADSDEKAENYRTPTERTIASAPAEQLEPQTQYKVYRRRYVGLCGIILLNIVGGMSWPWFGPIANTMVEDWGLTLSQTAWLGNITACLYLPMALAMPSLIARLGIRRCCYLGAVCFVISAWVRYSGTVGGLSKQSTFALFILGQAFASVSQTVYQVLAPVYSERWFDLKTRTTATMVCSLANPIGSALGQLISPLAGTTKQSILVLGIICTAVVPAVFLVQSEPPTPPTYAASQSPPPFLEFLRGLFGRSKDSEHALPTRNKIDFIIVTVAFGLLVAAVNTFSILTGTIMSPAGYSDDDSGLMGATLLLSGVVSAVIVSPLMDRVFTKHLAITLKALSPVLAGAWLSLVWAVKPHNIGGLYAVMVIIGISAVTMLPLGLELACDLTHNAEASSALLWFAANGLTIIFVLVEDALRAPPDANPPSNMRRGLIFQGVLVMFAMVLVFCIRGHQTRKELDVEKARDASASVSPGADAA